MKQVFLPLAFVLLFSPNFAFSQVAGNSTYSNSEKAQIYDYNPLTGRGPVTNAPIVNHMIVEFEVNGLLNAVAEDYVAMFNVTQVGATAEETDRLMGERIAAFKKILKVAGVDSNTVKVDMISFLPRFDYQVEKKAFSKTFNEVPAGFELQKNITVHYKSSGKLDDIITAAAKTEIYDLVKVDYFVEDITGKVEQLRNKCIASLDKKQIAYEALGFKLDTLRKAMAENYHSIYPITRYQSYNSFCRPSLDAATKKGILAPEERMNALPKTPSKYYNQVNYDDYDVVINSAVDEPVVQFSYTISIRYLLDMREKPLAQAPAPPQPTKQFFIVTPAGDVKPLPQ